MAVVYLAEHAQLKSKVAVKMMVEDLASQAGFRGMFFYEAKRQADLIHPNIVAVTDFFEEDDRLYMVQQFIDGESVDKRIKRLGRLEEREALKIMADALAGLDFAHRHSIIHRDVKPSNIMLDKDKRGRITDFGIAVQAGGKAAFGDEAGTPGYMSPEQITEPAKADHRTDVYSCGVTLFEMLTGRLPFDASNEHALLDPHLSKLNETLSAGVVNIIHRAMSKEASQRYAGCGEMLEDVSALLGGPQAKRNLVLLTLVLVLVVVAGYLKIKQNPTKVVTVQTVDEKSSRKSAHALITSAAHILRTSCRESANLKLKNRGAEIADASGDSGTADSYRKQAQDLSEGLVRLREEFDQALDQLASIPQEYVKPSYFEARADPAKEAADQQAVDIAHEFYLRWKIPAERPAWNECLLDQPASR